MTTGRRVDLIQNAVMGLAEGVALAEDMDGVNLAGVEARGRLDELPTRMQRLTTTLWLFVFAILLSDMLAVGPIQLGLLPELHIFQHLVGHPYSVEAGHALYHIDKLGDPHFLGAKLPWGSIF